MIITDVIINCYYKIVLKIWNLRWHQETSLCNFFLVSDISFLTMYYAILLIFYDTLIHSFNCYWYNSDFIEIMFTFSKDHLWNKRLNVNSVSHVRSVLRTSFRNAPRERTWCALIANLRGASPCTVKGSDEWDASFIRGTFSENNKMWGHEWQNNGSRIRMGD